MNSLHKIKRKLTWYQNNCFRNIIPEGIREVLVEKYSSISDEIVGERPAVAEILAWADVIQDSVTFVDAEGTLIACVVGKDAVVLWSE